jgi:hypothetical protein
VVDHIKPWRTGKTEQERYDLFWDVNNWNALCNICHNSAKKLQEHYGVYPGCDSNGVPLDKHHFWITGKKKNETM